MQHIKNIIKFLVLLPISISRIFENIYEKILRTIFNSQFSSTIRTNYIKNNNLRHQTVTHKSKNGDTFNATFFTPNAICQFRADTFSTKEPEMLEWIDDYGDNGVFFDIGANIGLYSVYFAKNLSDKPIVGTATFNVTPAKVGQYFMKIDCFCFVEQLLKPGESMNMPVTFFIDPDIYKDENVKEVNEITLSYTFMKSMDQSLLDGNKL